MPLNFETFPVSLSEKITKVEALDTERNARKTAIGLILAVSVCGLGIQQYLIQQGHRSAASSIALLIANNPQHPLYTKTLRELNESIVILKNKGVADEDIPNELKK